MKLGFAPRIAMVVTLILGCGIATTAMLSLHKYESTLFDFLTSRFEFIVNDIRQGIETQLDLGLFLADMQHESEILDSIMATDEQILSIEIFDPDGVVLFSTDPSFIGDLVTEKWLDAGQDNQSRQVWSILEIDAGVVGALLHNNLGQHTGSLALRYSRAFLDGSVTSQSSRVLVMSAVIILGTALVSMGGMVLLLRTQRRREEDLKSALDKVIGDCRDGEALALVKTECPELVAFSQSVFGSNDEIHAATEEIRKLDEEGLQ